MATWAQNACKSYTTQLTVSVVLLFFLKIIFYFFNKRKAILVATA